jgi:LPXTG-motif cell wall-anchored protein
VRMYLTAFACSGQPTPKSSTDATPIIVGTIVGAAVLLAALVLGVFFWRRRRRAAVRRQDMDYFERKAPSRGTLLDAGLPNVSRSVTLLIAARDLH